MANDGIFGRVESGELPRGFRERLSIEQEATDTLSQTSRQRFQEALDGGTYPDTESQLQLLRYYQIQDAISLLTALEKQTGGPVVQWRGRLIPNPVHKQLVDQYRESARYFRILGLDQEQRGSKEQGNLWRGDGRN